MKIGRKHLLLIGIVLVLMGILQFGWVNATAAQPKGVMKLAIHWNFSADWLDPATAGAQGSTGLLPLYFFQDSLLKMMSDGTALSPCLAESWTISPDYKVYEFKLHKGVKFHNGDTMTVEDVIFSFGRYKSAEFKLIHDKTELVEAVNPYHIRIRFKEAFPDFLDYFLPGVSTIGWVVPKKYMEKVGVAGFKKHPIGCGPYKFVEFVPGVKLVGEAFEDYWRKVPNIKRLEYYNVGEGATRLAMVRRGEVDIATMMQGVYYEDVKRDPKLRMLEPVSPSQMLVFFTAQWDPKSPWSDARVRKAASLAIDRKTLADIHAPGCKGIGVLGLESDPTLVRFPPDPYDPEGAKKLLAEAGYPKGFHGGTFYPYEGGYWAYGEQVANYWKAVGITLDTRLLDRPAWFANRQGGKMKGATFIDPSPGPMVDRRLSYLFRTGSYGNYPDIQALWDEYRREIAPEARKNLLARIQKLIYERTMWIPLTTLNVPSAIGPRVKGDPWKVQPLLWIPALPEDIELEK